MGWLLRREVSEDASLCIGGWDCPRVPVVSMAGSSRRPGEVRHVVSAYDGVRPLACLFAELLKEGVFAVGGLVGE
jgi:hypothetical protein